MEKILYKGYVIQPETDPWALKYGNNFRFYLEGEGSSDCIRWTSTIEEAKDEISERVFLKSYPKNWFVSDYASSGNIAPLTFLTDAVQFATRYNGILLHSFTAP